MEVDDVVSDQNIQKLLIYGFKCFLTSLKLVDKEKEVSHQMSFTRGKLNCETYEQHSLMPKWQSLELTTSWNIQKLTIPHLITIKDMKLKR